MVRIAKLNQSKKPGPKQERDNSMNFWMKPASIILIIIIKPLDSKNFSIFMGFKWSNCQNFANIEKEAFLASTSYEINEIKFLTYSQEGDIILLLEKCSDDSFNYVLLL